MTDNKYRNLSIVLGIVAIVFAALYFTKDAEVGGVLEDATTKLTECRSNIAEWQNKYGGASMTEDAREELDDIIADCNTDVEDLDENI